MPLYRAAAAGLAGAIFAASHGVADDNPAAGGQRAPDAKLECSGELALGRGLSSLAVRAKLSFEVSISFGEGEILALVDPESSKVEKVIYDAELTSGSMRLADGYEATIVWTRMSGSAGPLVGQAITGDGDVIALSVDRAAAGSTERPFVLFAAASASAYRGTCASNSRPD